MNFQFQSNSRKGGIYRITNKINGKFYIGSCKRFKERWYDHARTLEKGTHSNPLLLMEYRRHGPDSFVFTIIEVIDGTKEDRLQREQELLNQYYDKQVMCLNIRPYATSSESYKQAKTQTRKLRSNAMKRLWETQREELLAERKKRYDESNTRLAISNALKAYYQTEAGMLAKEKKHGRKKGNKDYSFLSPEGEVYVGRNVYQFALEHNLDFRALGEVMSGKAKTHKGWKRFEANNF